MAVTLRCPKHPHYKAIHRPRPTTKHPEGCIACRAIHYAAGHAFRLGATLLFVRQ